MRASAPVCVCVCVCVYSTAVPANLHSVPGSLSGHSLEPPCLLHSHPLYKSCGHQSPLLICVTQYFSMHSLSLDQWFLIRAAAWGHLTMSAEMPGLF